MLYKLIDIDGNEYSINEGTLIPSTVRGSLSRSGESFVFSQEIIERSFLPGSVVVGSSRLEAKSFILSASWALTTDQTYDKYINTLILNLEKAVILEDTTNSKRANVTILSMSVSYDEGAIKRSGEFSISLQILDGFWMSSTPEVITQTLSAGTSTIPLSNTGYLPTYAVIDISVSSALPQLDIYIDETKEGLQLIDNTLGTPTLTELSIDNLKGTLTIAEFDRSQSITPGSGYFPIPVGGSNLVVENPDAALDITISYYRRFYV